MKMLGLIAIDLSWKSKTETMTQKAYSRLWILKRLKKQGANLEDLIDIYSLFIRSCAEYCSVAFHPSLINKQSKKIENIQKTILKIILSDNYVACGMTGPLTLAERRQNSMLSFAKKFFSHPENSRLFLQN